MPSFDIVSAVDKHELTNAVDQANRELTTRFDFKGVEASYARDENVITQSAPSDFQVQQMADILRARLVARKIDVRCLEFGDVDTNLAGDDGHIGIDDLSITFSATGPGAVANVPEPGAVALLATGLLGLLGRRRRIA